MVRLTYAALVIGLLPASALGDLVYAPGGATVVQRGRDVDAVLLPQRGGGVSVYGPDGAEAAILPGIMGGTVVQRHDRVDAIRPSFRSLLGGNRARPATNAYLVDGATGAGVELAPVVSPNVDGNGWTIFAGDGRSSVVMAGPAPGTWQGFNGAGWYVGTLDARDVSAFGLDAR